ncbi:hypothetical protein ACKWTF_014140 [Chironomus riparius]
MSVKISFLIFTLFLIKSTTSVEESCQMKQDVLKEQYETLLQTFSLTAPSPSPSKCAEYLDEFYKTVDEINEDSFIDQIKGDDFVEARKQYEADRDYMENSFENTKAYLKEQFEAQEQDLSSKIAFASSEIDRITTAEQKSIKQHQEMVKTYNKCGYQPDDVYNVSRKSKSSFMSSRRLKFSDEPTVMCDVPGQWFLNLKKLMDEKVYSPDKLLPTDDCNKKRKWFLSVNSIFQEAIDQIAASYDIETYKATLEKRLTDRKREIDDTINQMKKDNERKIQQDTDFLQTKNAELQVVTSHFEGVKKQQDDEIEALAVKLMGCSRYELMNDMIDEVDEKDFMKTIFIKTYESSTNNDKAENLMLFLGTLKDLCRRFEGYIILYYEIVSQKDQESPTMIEIVNQIRNLRQPGATCGVEYDQNDFLSPTLEADPIVNKILATLSDSIKVGNYDKTITFNYDYTYTFQQILSTLVSKSYTGGNLDNLLGFTDELYWLVNKYDVLSQMLDISAPTNDKDKKKFKDLVDKIAKSDALNHEDTDRLIGLREKMKRYGIK